MNTNHDNRDEYRDYMSTQFSFSKPSGYSADMSLYGNLQKPRFVFQKSLILAFKDLSEEERFTNTCSVIEDRFKQMGVT